jgi:hypothetical protein
MQHAGAFFKDLLREEKIQSRRAVAVFRFAFLDLRIYATFGGAEKNRRK